MKIFGSQVSASSKEA